MNVIDAVDVVELVRILEAQRNNYRQVKEATTGREKSIAKAKEEAVIEVLRVVREIKWHDVEVES